MNYEVGMYSNTPYHLPRFDKILQEKAIFSNASYKIIKYKNEKKYVWLLYAVLFFIYFFLYL